MVYKLISVVLYFIVIPIIFAISMVSYALDRIQERGLKKRQR